MKQLDERIHEFEHKRGQNSNNSSNPPSGEGFRKPS
ncbi:DUF6444 domain-containing protein [Paenibacillus sp. L3-i20]